MFKELTNTQVSALTAEDIHASTEGFLGSILDIFKKKARDPDKRGWFNHWNQLRKDLARTYLDPKWLDKQGLVVGEIPADGAILALANPTTGQIGTNPLGDAEAAVKKIEAILDAGHKEFKRHADFIHAAASAAHREKTAKEGAITFVKHMQGIKVPHVDTSALKTLPGTGKRVAGKTHALSKEQIVAGGKFIIESIEVGAEQVRADGYSVDETADNEAWRTNGDRDSIFDTMHEVKGGSEAQSHFMGHISELKAELYAAHKAMYAYEALVHDYIKAIETLMYRSVK